MADANTILYASRGNGGSPSVAISEIATALAAADVAALTSVGPGVPAADLVDVTAAFSQPILNANFATLGTSVNAILASLKAAGLML